MASRTSQVVYSEASLFSGRAGKVSCVLAKVRDQGKEKRFTKIVFFSIYVPNIGAPKYIEQILTVTNEETDSNTIQ